MSNSRLQSLTGQEHKHPFKRFLLLITIGLSCTVAANNAPVDPLDYEQCSIVNLMATPERYHEKKVATTGYCKIEFERKAIYLTKEHAILGIPQSAVWIEFSDDFLKNREIGDLNNMYIMVFGVYDQNRNGHMGNYQGTIAEIVRVIPWSSVPPPDARE